METLYFNEITLLVTHYNRSSSLENLLRCFSNQGIGFREIIVSDDSSSEEHVTRLTSMQKSLNFKLVTTAKNKGLGNNINKGQDAVTSRYTLYVQEDFEPTYEFREYLKNALDIMNKEAKWDIIRFYSFHWATYPYLQEYKLGFSEMLYMPDIWHSNHLKFYLYSDHPHLRRSSFFQKFGRYSEGIAGDVTEYNMCLRFLKNGGKGLIASNPNMLFIHENSEAEPSTMQRSSLRLNTPHILNTARYFYLKLKVLKSTIKLLTMQPQ